MKTEALELSDAVIQAAKWLQELLEEIPFGEIGITLVIHNGEVTRLVKSISEKLKA